MSEHPCCPRHPDAKHMLVVDDMRNPDFFDSPDFWLVWSCQNMSPPFEGAPKIRCGYRHPVKKWRS